MPVAVVLSAKNMQYRLGACLFTSHRPATGGTFFSSPRSISSFLTARKACADRGVVKFPPPAGQNGRTGGCRRRGDACGAQQARHLGEETANGYLERIVAGERLVRVEVRDPAGEAAAQWALVSHNGGHRIAHRLSAYLDERVRCAGPWRGAVCDWLKPLGFAGGLQGSVAPIHLHAGLRELRPSATVIKLPGVGHYPPDRRPGRIHRGRTAPAHRIAAQLRKLVTAVASSGDADVARF